MLGEKLRGFRETKGLLQRQVAADLQVDTTYVSKMEHSEKPVSRIHLKKLSQLYDIPENELLSIWLADKVFQLVKREEFSITALELVINKLKSK